MLHGRTEVLGGHLLQCDHCDQEHDVYHSCRNRSGPKCHRQDTEAWLQERRQELLPVPYFPVVFTVPHALGHSSGVTNRTSMTSCAARRPNY